MVAFAKLLARILSGTSDKNLAFADLRAVLLRCRFIERIKGGHHIFHRDGVAEILNLQDKNGQAKPYQVKQARDIIVRYRLSDLADEGADNAGDHDAG